ncbi:MAG: hypothetical protein ACSHYA_00760 [Opitutaceae bacterium]
MSKCVCALLLASILVSIGCSPKGNPVSASGPYVLVTDPWSRFFTSDPTVYCVPKMSDELKSILDEQQILAGSVLSATGKREERPEFFPLLDRLEILKSAIPSTETKVGYASRRSGGSGDRSAAYSASDNSYHYARNGSGSSGYRSTFSSVHKTSSPALARSVENLVLNASLSDLDQRIDGLEQLISVWSKKAEVMSSNGMEGVMRSANLAYLRSLKDYTDDFLDLQKSLEDVVEQADMAESNRDLHLQQWAHFEETRLPLLHDYVQNKFRHKVVSHEAGRYMLPPHLDQDLVILACTIGDRVLYFELFRREEARHPFRLLYIGG